MSQTAQASLFPAKQPSIQGPWSLPSGWEWVSLRVVCQINPRRPRLERSEDTPTSFLPMSGVDEIDGVITGLEVRPCKDVARGFTYFEEEDVLFAKITPSMQNGKCAIARGLLDGIGFGSTEFHVVRPNRGVIADWVHRFLRRFSFRLEAKEHFRGAVGQQRVPEEFLASSLIPVPLTLDIQRRIVARIEALLAELKEMRNLATAIRRDTDRVMDAALKEVFPPSEETFPPGWRLFTIEEIKPIDRDPVQTGPFGAQLKSAEFAEAGVPVVAIGNVQWGELDTRKLYYVTEAKARQLARYKLEPGDILFTRMGTVGRSCVVPQFADGWLMTYHLIRIAVDPQKANPQFIFYCFRGSPTVAEQIRQKGKGATREGVNSEILRKLRLPLPLLRVQQELIAYLDAVQAEVEEMRRLQMQDAELLDQLEQSILERAFRGEL